MECSEIGFSIVLGLLLTCVMIFFGESIQGIAQWFDSKHSVIARRAVLPPPSTQVDPEFFHNSLNLWIHTTCWRAARGVNWKGSVIIVHGLNEHANCYSALAKHLNSVGFDVHALDLQGHGQSEGDRLYVQSFEDYVTDLKQFVKIVKKEYKPGSPMFLYSHSMGGLISILALEDECDLVNGAVFSAPSLVIQQPTRIPFWYSILLFLEKIVPKMSIPTLGVKYCSRNWVSTERKRRDVLRTQTIGAKVHTALEIFRAAEKGRSHLEKLVVPFLSLMGSDDYFVDTAEVKNLLEQKAGSKDKTCRLIAGAYHELHNELEIVTVKTFKETSEWFLNHLPKSARV